MRNYEFWALKLRAAIECCGWKIKHAYYQRQYEKSLFVFPEAWYHTVALVKWRGIYKVVHFKSAHTCNLALKLALPDFMRVDDDDFSFEDDCWVFSLLQIPCDPEENSLDVFCYWDDKEYVNGKDPDAAYTLADFLRGFKD